jgi:hypothetical protein
LPHLGQGIPPTGLVPLDDPTHHRVTVATQVELHQHPEQGRLLPDQPAQRTSTPTRCGRLLTPSTLHRIRATLRSALNAAIRDGLVRGNPARYVEVPSPRRPQAQVWTEPRVEQWRRTGQRFAVAVWDHPAGRRVAAW